LAVRTLFSYADNPQQKRIVEEVTVTNVQVSVRVQKNEKPITNLTREDFTLYEDNQKREINGFFLVKKNIKTPEPMESRIFVLLINATGLADELQKAIEYMFDNVFSPQDRLLIIINGKTLEYSNLEDSLFAKKQVLQSLKEECERYKTHMIDIIDKLEEYLDVNDFAAKVIGSYRVRPHPQYIVEYLKKYLAAWDEYKKAYLFPKMDQLYYLSRYLENYKAKKWIFNFYHFDLFPRIRFSKSMIPRLRFIPRLILNQRMEDPNYTYYSGLIEPLVKQLDIESNLLRTYPTEEVSKLFYKADATFNSFYIRSTSDKNQEDIEYHRTSSEVEKIFSKISEINGGKHFSSNNLTESLQKAALIEDAYYILTYAPPGGKKSGQLKVSLKNKGCRVLYDNNLPVDEFKAYKENFEKAETNFQIPDIKIIQPGLKNRILTFTIKDYLMRKTENSSRQVGNIRILVQLLDADENIVIDEMKIITAQKKEMKLDLDFFIDVKGGEYNLIIDVIDLLTDKEDFYQAPVVLN